MLAAFGSTRHHTEKRKSLLLSNEQSRIRKMAKNSKIERLFNFINKN